MSLLATSQSITLKLHLMNLGAGILLTSAILLSDTERVHKFWTWNNSGIYIKNIVIISNIMSFILLTLMTINYHFSAPNTIRGATTVMVYYINVKIDDLSLLYLMLMGTLMPAVTILADLDHNPRGHKYLVLQLIIYLVASILIITTDLITFYALYELLIMLVFFTMYLSTSARGCIEASMFFLGWAALGSIFVGIAVIYIITIAGSADFTVIRHTSLTSDEIFWLYTLSFCGFGTKLSLWPFWYWLPRAHVEVSTSMSIFLSCILIKICLYCLTRFWWGINSEVVVSPFIFLIALCIFDVTCRLIIQIDLKAVIAYGSVLHINLLVLLILLDTNALTLGTALYIWGHSLSTAGLFFAVSLIERCFGTRTTCEISGAYQANPAIGLISIFAVIGFLDFPLAVFFWGELWLWITAFSVLPLAAAFMMFCSCVIYLIIFFRIWWGVLFGASSHTTKCPVTTITWNDAFMTGYLIMVQFGLGLQPNVVCLSAIS